MLLQEISACKQCIVFNSDQYKKIYWNLVDEEKESVFQEIVDEMWAKEPILTKNWGDDCHYTC